MKADLVSSRTLQELAREAILIQDACNPSGLAHGYSEMISELSQLLRAGGQWDSDRLARHPINRLWVSKLHDLARMGLSDFDVYHIAYTECKRLAQQE